MITGSLTSFLAVEEIVFFHLPDSTFDLDYVWGVQDDLWAFGLLTFGSSNPRRNLQGIQFQH